MGLGGSLGLHSFVKDPGIGNVLASITASTVSAAANAGARSLINGSDFGDNLIAALPDVISSTVGNWLSGATKGSGSTGTNDFASATEPAPAIANGLQPKIGKTVDVASPVPNDFWGETTVKARRGLWDFRSPAPSFSNMSLSMRLLFGRPGTTNRDIIQGRFYPPGYSAASRARQAEMLARSHGPMVTAIYTSQPLATQITRITSSISSGADSISWSSTARRILLGNRSSVMDAMFGPRTPWDYMINRPFYTIAGWISDSPLGDPGGWMSLEQAGASIDARLGAPGETGYLLSSGLRWLVNGYRASEVERVAAPVMESVEGGTTYAVRLNQTPISNGFWTGLRGESTFVSTHPDVAPIMGSSGIEYHDAFADFFPESAGQVEIPNMTINRGANFTQADRAFSDLTGLNSQDIRIWRRSNNYVWHEGDDLRTMQLVPEIVNSRFPHYGGIGEINAGAIRVTR